MTLNLRRFGLIGVYSRMFEIRQQLGQFQSNKPLIL